MKKLFFTLCALCLSTTTWAVGYNQTEWADSDRGTVYQDAATSLYFYVLDGNAVLTYADASESNYSSLTALTIPETVSDGTTTYTVTKVGDYAFDHATTIAGTLTIPANILTLGRSAFEGCTGITEVIIDYAETNLANSNNQNWGTPFYSCSGIKTVTLNRNLTQGRSYSSSYRTELFSDLTNIETVYIGEHVTTIIHSLFHCNSNDCKLATVYSYAATVPALESEAFGSHTGLTLHVCQSLLSDYQSSSWTTYFSTITNDLPDPGLEEGTYKDLTTGLYFEINEDGTASIYHDELGVYTDANLVAHATITDAYTLPEQVSADGTTYYNVTRIEANAFAYSGISGHLYIPAFITAMGASAFEGSTHITEVTYEYSPTALTEENRDNMKGNSFSGCTGVITVNMYRDISSRAGYQSSPFVGVSSVVTFNIGPRVTAVPDYMFRTGSGMNGLRTINCYAAVPPTLSTNPFGELSSECVAYVPKGSEDTYKASTWASVYSGLSRSELSNAYAVDITYSDGEENGNYYATYYNSKGVDIYPQGGTTNTVTTYAIPSVTKGEETAYVNLTEVGATVPAATAVLVEASAAATYTVIETTAANSASYSGGNCLYGLDTAGTITGEDGYYYYILTYPASEENGTALGFYWATEDGSATSYEFAAHKAYLMLEKSALDNVKSVALRKGEGDTTGITTIEENTAATTSTGIYTVQGVRVSNMNKQGLYIVDGKKVLVK